jgi:hypothetical protein
VTHVLILAALCIARLPALAQTPAPPPVGQYTVSGIVVNASTGAALDRATVTLSTTGANATAFAEAQTGETGSFRFDGLPAGKYALEATHRGYIGGGYQQHSVYFTAIVTGPGLASQDLRFALTPYGSMSGAVTDDAGNPIAGARVGLFRENPDQGDGRIQSAGQETTDDAGAWEFARLRPGTYYVDVSATPWYASRPPTWLDSQGEALSVDRQPPSPLDVAYPLTFYPNASDSGSASPIPVNGGDHVRANFSLHAVPAIHIQIRVPLPAERRRGISAPELSQEVFGDAESTQSLDVGNIMINRSDNTMTVDYNAVAPGHYMIRQGDQSPVPLDAASSRTLDAPPPLTGADVTGKFAMASGAPLPDHVFVMLRPVANQPTHFSMPVASDGTFHFQSVSPGTYDMQVTSLARTLAVARMAASGAEIHGTRFTIGSDPVLVAATLASGSATVTGYAKRDGQGVGGTMVLLLPSDPDAAIDIIRRDQSDSDGSFALNDVIPGNYVLVSIDNGWTLDWANRAVLAPYLAHGLKVHVPENQKTINLPDAIAVLNR